MFQAVKSGTIGDLEEIDRSPAVEGYRCKPDPTRYQMRQTKYEWRL